MTEIEITYWINRVMIPGKKYKITDEQIEIIKLIWNEIHVEFWFSLNENTLVKFEL